jgi:predicted Zn-dependent peptidase
MFDTYAWFTEYLERLAQVTPLDVQHAAQAYLCQDRRVVGIYLPNGEEIASEEDEE